MVLHIMNLFSSAERYRSFFTKALFSISISFHFGLSAQEVKKDWDANVTFGIGNVGYMNRFQTGILQSSFSLLFRPFNSSEDFEAKFKIMTQSPTKEEDGFIEVPLRDYDFSQISELWLRYQIFKQLELKAGRFPDTPDETTPISWPYYSVFAKVDLYKDEKINPFILVRQDILSVYSYQANNSSATNIERSRIELDLNTKFKNENNSMNINLKINYDQFSDPEYALSSISIGREQYIDRTVTVHDLKYRIVDLFSEFNYDFYDILLSKVIFKYWKNLDASSYSEGNLFGIEEKFHLKNTSLSIGYNKFFAEQSSSPPSSLSSYYFPGFQISSLDIKLSHTLLDSLSALLEYRYQRASPYGQSSDILASPGTVPVIPQYKIFLMLEYNFDSSRP